MEFKKWFREQFPERFHQGDTNINSEGKGTWIRYVEIFGEEIDQQFFPFMVNFMDLFDTITIPDKYLGHLSFILGLPPSVDNNFAVYRKVLAYAVTLYKIKGTAKSYELLFNLLGLNIKITEEVPRKAVRYDSDFFYDTGLFYDDECEHCSYYSIIYYNPDAPLEPVPQEILDKFMAVICFIQPINAKLRGFIRSLFFEDNFILDIGEDVLGFNEDPGGGFSEGFDIENSFN